MKFKFYCILTILLTTGTALYGQQNSLDSLKQLINNQKSNESTPQIYLEIALEEQQNNADSAEHYFNLAFTSAQNVNKAFQTNVLIDYTEYLMTYAGQFQKSDSLLKLALDFEQQRSDNPQHLLTIYKWQCINSGLLKNEEESNTAIQNADKLISASAFDPKTLGIYYSDIAEYYGIIGDLENYTKSLITAIDHYAKIDDTYGISVAYLNLAIKHINIQQYEKAQSFALKALELLDPEENAFLMGHCNVILMASNSELNFPNKALTYGNKALEIWRSLNNSNQVAAVLRNLATLHRKAREFDVALIQINESIQLFQRLKIPHQLAYSWAEKAMIHAKAKQVKRATAALDSFELVKDISTTDISDKIELLEITEEVYARIGDFENAYLCQKELSAIRDSIVTTENLATIEELETKYFTKEKDAEIAFQESQLSQQKTILWILSLLILSLIGMAFIFWKNARLRKKVNRQLLELDAAKTSFFANISHELRTPLTLIIAPIARLLETTKNQSLKEELSLVHSNGKKLSKLVDEILDLSKLEGGKMELKESPVSLEQLLRRIFYSYHSLAQMKDIILSFSYHLPEDLGIVLDVEKVEKVLNNLLSNAFKHSNSGGVITLRVSSSNTLTNNNTSSKSTSMNSEKWIKIEVQDTGKGIPVEEQKKIFDRFYQIGNPHNNYDAGTGIGLSYAKEIAKFLDGELIVSSEEDKGSTFIFYLPFKKTKIDSRNYEIPYPDEEQSTKSHYTFKETNHRSRVLIVEDNPELSQFLSRVMSKLYDCTTASDGIKALEMLKRESFDLVISDVMMPNMDGFELLKSVKSKNEELRIPIILLTARAMEEDKIKALRLGVDDYLTKPFNVNELIARSQNLIQNKLVRDASLKERKEEPQPEEHLSFEKQQLSRAEQIVVEHISDSKFKVDDLARELNYSRRQVERIIKKLTGLTPGGFIREIRLQKARTLLENRHYATIAEVRYAVGFDNASHFSKIFQDRFGIKPSMVG